MKGYFNTENKRICKKQWNRRKSGGLFLKKLLFMFHEV